MLHQWIHFKQNECIRIQHDIAERHAKRSNFGSKTFGHADVGQWNHPYRGHKDNRCHAQNGCPFEQHGRLKAIAAMTLQMHVRDHYGMADGTSNQ